MPVSGFACPIKRSMAACLLGAGTLLASSFAASLPGEALANAAANDGKNADGGRSVEAAPTLMSQRKRRRGGERRGGERRSGERRGGEGRKRDRVGDDFGRADKDGDGKLSRAEWSRRGNFGRLDTDKDGALSLGEVRAMYEGHDEKSYDWPPQGMPVTEPVMDPAAKKDFVGSEAPDRQAICTIKRGRGCEPKAAIEGGLLETGLGPVFPEGANCPGIDDYFAMDYTFKRGREAYHGGIDMPVRWGTPMITAAAGTVVGKFMGENSMRGIEIAIRHSPEDTGIPLWIYTHYGHLDRMPEQEIGQRVKMGEILGPTGNSGISGGGKKQTSLRRPAIHFAVFYSESPKYAISNEIVFPMDGRWMDPIALYRQKTPLDTGAMKSLPEEDKAVAIPVMFEDGESFPAGTKFVWPYACARR